VRPAFASDCGTARTDGREESIGEWGKARGSWEQWAVRDGKAVVVEGQGLADHGRDGVPGTEHGGGECGVLASRTPPRVVTGAVPSRFQFGVPRNRPCTTPIRYASQQPNAMLINPDASRSRGTQTSDRRVP